MKVLLVNGSPNEFGCTYTALSEVTKSLDKHQIEWEIFHIGKKTVHGCNGCGACQTLGKCVFDDDVCNEMAQKMVESDGMIVGSPVYFAGPNGALCALLDRAFYSIGSLLSNKPAASVVSCRRGGASATFDRLNKYFTIKRMPVVSSQYWNSVHGLTPDDVKKDLEGLQTMRTLGDNLAWMLQSIQSAAITPPVIEDWIPTSFIR